MLSEARTLGSRGAIARPPVTSSSQFGPQTGASIGLSVSAERGNHILQRNFAPILRRAGLPPMRFHDLHHTAATLLLMQGIHPKIVSEMLGHATISMTLDTYIHVLPDMQRDATAAFDRLFGEE